MDAHLYPIQELLDALNWSRKDLADYMGISRPLLNHYMAGRRDIKGINKFRFSQLFLMTFKSPENKTLLAETQKAEKEILKSKLELRNKFLIQEIAKAEKQLAEVKNQYASTFTYYKLLMQLDDTIYTIKLDDTEKQKIEEMKYYWRNQLTKFDTSKQHSLALKIHLLKQELAFNGKVK